MDVQAFIRRRKEVLAFAVGVALFVGGAVNLTRNHQRTASDPLGGARPDPPRAARSVEGHVGPQVGASVGAHIEKRRAELRKIASARPKDASWAVASFDAYREPEAVLSLLSGRTLSVAAFQQRVPAPRFPAETVPVGGDPVGVVLERRAGAAVAAGLERQRAALEGLLPTVTDASYRRVYEAEAARLDEAAKLLRTKPATVYALVVRGSNDALSKLSRTPGVRLVDVADDPAATPSTHTFHGLLPDDLRVATTGAPAD
ncbi:MAG: hypothetical protein ACRDJO_04920 [Actinomycetota bacterium]